MPLILAIEPDKRQAAQLKVLVRNRLRADLILADTTELALEAIGDRIPDLVLVPALLSPEEDGALNQALRVIAHAAHVQTLTIPVFSSAHAKKAPAKSGGLLSKLLSAKDEGAPEGCDPAVFGDQIASYLAEAAASRGDFDEEEEFSEPRPSPKPALTRVQTFEPPERVEPPIVAPEEPQVRPTYPSPYPTPPTVVREPDATPVVDPNERRTPGFDALFRPRTRVDEVVEAQPVEEAIEEVAPAGTDADADWAPPADQSIGIDLPPPDEGEPATTYEAEPAIVEPVEPAEDTSWQQPEPAETEQPEVPTWTPPPGRPEWRVAKKPADPAPPDLLAEFTADLTASAKPKPKRMAAIPPSARAKPTVAAPPPRPVPPKSQPAPGQPGPRPTPPPRPPLAAKPSARPAPAAEVETAAEFEAAPAHQSSVKPKHERPEWTALIDSLRQDMERMRLDRGGRSKAAAPVVPAPKRPVAEPTPARVPVAPRPPAAAAAPVAMASPDPVAPAVTTAPPARTSPTEPAGVDPAKRKKRAQKATPVQDEWGFFDPQQCGFAALLAKLDEITENEEKSV